MLINILYPISTMSILALISNSNDSSNLDCFQNINYFCNETINLRQCHLIELECELQAKGTSADEIPERTNENIPSSDSQNILELFSRYLIIFMDSSNLKMSK